MLKNCQTACAELPYWDPSWCDPFRLVREQENGGGRVQRPAEGTGYDGFFIHELIFGEFGVRIFFDWNQLMVNWWFGLVVWDSILGVPLSNNPLHKGIPGIQTTNPNHQLTNNH